MGAKYSSQATSGYNASPPSDDGTQAASNLITWSGIKSKLADILKTFGEAINTALVSAFDYSVRQISTSDSTVASDHMRCVEIAPTVTTAVTVSLGDAATMTTVYRVFIKNSSAINQTVGRVTVGDTIDGTAANVTLAPGEGRIFQTNSTPNGYLTNGRFGPFVDTNPIAVGSSDGTKKVRLEVDGLTTGTTRVITPPDEDFTIVGVATAQTLTNKTLTAGVLGGTTDVSGGQLKFPAAQSASADANTLDDYEEGTWTPTIRGDSTPGTQTYSTQSGRYTKIGRLVHVEFRVTMTAKDGTTAGSIFINGIPFSIGATIGGGAVSDYSNVDLAAGQSQLMLVSNGGALYLKQGGDNSSSAFIAAAAIANTTEIAGSAMYSV